MTIKIRNVPNVAAFDGCGVETALLIVGLELRAPPPHVDFT